MKNNIAVENVADSVLVPAMRISEFVNWLLAAQAQVTPWSITYIFVDDRFIIDLNKQFFAKSTPTDVISFNLTESADEPEGEVYISVETAAANAAEYDVTMENELLRLVAHGTLHLLGYDDATEEDRNNMTFLENKALDYAYSV